MIALTKTPCPFCGQNDTGTVSNDKTTQAICLHCGATGPLIAVTRDLTNRQASALALHAWGVRHAC
jgi:Lar family restriction alleviation protein